MLSARGVPAEFAEIFLSAEHRVDLEVVGGVVAMVACRLEDGIEVDGGDAHLGEPVKVRGDAAQGAAIEIPAAMEPSSARS